MPSSRSTAVGWLGERARSPPGHRLEDRGRTSSADQPTDVRIAQHDSVDDPQFSALLLQFGRYLLISSSQPGTQSYAGRWRPRPDRDGAATGCVTPGCAATVGGCRCRTSTARPGPRRWWRRARGDRPRPADEHRQFGAADAAGDARPRPRHGGRGRPSRLGHLGRRPTDDGDDEVAGSRQRPAAESGAARGVRMR
ncbi:glycosyl hydrolase family 95 catalytic domain-containing protein [Micromonospora craniellae]|uniref:glycosyl hydrolase family 95 catalytic domain-containing protein n=1 Tax=Micromonospora craniellae TaxID=2294034 RepID=UPI003988F6AB